MRKERFINDCVYHVYNRGVEKRKIFLGESYYHRFLSIIEHYLQFNYPYSLLQQRLKKADTQKKKQEILTLLEFSRITPGVEIISFCLMPNHYHLSLRQLQEEGVSNFMHRIGTSYTNYFNIKEDRSGRLFEGPFKARRVNSDDDLLNLTRYHHINPLATVENEREIFTYSWSSIKNFIGKGRFNFVNSDFIVKTQEEKRRYKKFVLAELDEPEILSLSKIAIDDDLGWFTEIRENKKLQREKNIQKYFSRAD